MPFTGRGLKRALFVAFTILALALAVSAQQPDGPQIDPPPPVARPAAPPRAPGQRLTVPAGTRLAVVLDNVISTRSATAGDSLYFHTAFPVSHTIQMLTPVASYLR